MDLTRFETLIEAYGARPERWPESERAAALDFLKRTPQAQTRLGEAAALDRVLDQAATAPVSRALEDRILASMPVRAARGRLWFGRPAWIPAAAFGCSLALGGIVGVFVPAMAGISDDALAQMAAFNALVGASDVGNDGGGAL